MRILFALSVEVPIPEQELLFQASLELFKLIWESQVG
jgi:hypothetical protein